MPVKIVVKTRGMDQAQWKLFSDNVRPALREIGFKFDARTRSWFKYVALEDAEAIKGKVRVFFTTWKVIQPNISEEAIGDSKKTVEAKKELTEEEKKKFQAELATKLAPFADMLKGISKMEEEKKEEPVKGKESVQEKIIPKPEPPKHFFVKAHSSNFQIVDEHDCIIGRFELFLDEEKLRNELKNGEYFASVELRDGWDKSYSVHGEFVYKTVDTSFAPQWKKILSRLKVKYKWSWLKPRLQKIKAKKMSKLSEATKELGKWYFNGSIMNGGSSCFSIRRKYKKFNDKIYDCYEFIDFKILGKELYIKYLTDFPTSTRSSWERLVSRNAVGELNGTSCWWKATVLSSYWLRDKIEYHSYEDYAKAFLDSLIQKLDSWRELDVKIPEIRGEPMPHQIEAFKFCMSRGNPLLAMDVRTGKTLVSLMYSKAMMDSDEIDKVVVFTNVTLKFVWEKQIKKWLGKRFYTDNVVFIEGIPQRRRRLWRSNKRIFIANYEQAADASLMLMSKKNRLMLIADECTYIKNVSAKRTKALMEIPAVYKVGLSGEPFERHFKEIHTIERWLGTKIFDSFEHFKRDYDLSRKSKNLVEKGLGRLHEYLEKTIMYRKTMGEISPDVPKPNVVERPIELSGESLEDYNSIYNVIQKLEAEYDEIIKQIKELHVYSPDYEEKLKRLGVKKSEISRSILAYFKIAHRFCDHPKLLSKAHSNSEWSMTAFKYFKNKKYSPKLEETLNILHTMTDPKEKVVIFTEYAPMADIIADTVEARLHRPSMVLSGKHPPSSERGRYLHKFEKSKKYNVLVMTDVGRFGLNLPYCNVGIIYDLPWNSTYLKQRIGRLLGMHKMEETTIYIPYVSDLHKIEQMVRGKLNAKSWLISQVIDGVLEESYTKWVRGVK